MEQRQGLSSIDYIEHQDIITSQYFCTSFGDSILETCDNLNLSNGILTRRIGINVLTGDEEWFYDRDSDTYYYYQYNKYSKDISGKYDKMMCTHFRWAKYSKNPKYGEFQGSDDNKIMFKYDKRRTENGDIDNFKKFLKEQYSKNKPVKVHFILQYPEISVVKNNYNPTPRFKVYNVDIGTNESVEPKIIQKYGLYFDEINK